ncbi:GDSL-type esterase/lipase family protein [Ruminococcus flavefaciens]|uniref:GDSL-type esterase/lipase family protein n=1 Tax=Ruminococcus flavefaciens TaxID=1265 RepID=UPI000378585D|nr:GDSL-type esterase/lipase family protein [Ruminococcus flavefaciens]
MKQCIYTVILLLTCVVASPRIYKQIWKNSEVSKPKAPAKPAVTSQTEKEPEKPTAETPDSSQPTSENETTAPADTTETTTAPAAPVNNFVQSGPEYFNDALFIGDSRTVGIRDYGTLKNADYFCDIGLSAYKIDNAYVNGNTVWGTLNAKKYGKIYVMLGINEVGNDIESTVAAYRKLVDGIREVQPDAVIYLMANLHVTLGYENNVINNERINMLNSRINEMADINKNICYIDENETFDNTEGALQDDITSDGAHLLAKYYSNWCEWLCSNTLSVGGVPAETPQAPGPEIPAATEAAPATTRLPQNEEFSNQ